MVMRGAIRLLLTWDGVSLDKLVNMVEHHSGGFLWVARRGWQSYYSYWTT